MSGITVIGALTLVTVASPSPSVLLGTAALVLATINVVGGFLVTDQMLSTFGGRR
jgi:H+-translocating NAD(P) transhydrogenase subunit alpha